MKKVTLFIIIFLFSIFSPAEQDENKWQSISSEILNTFRQSGEEGLISWINRNSNRVEHKLIDYFLKRGEQLGSEEMVKVSVLLAQELTSKKYTGIIYIMAGNFYFKRNQLPNAIQWYQKGLPLVEQDDEDGWVGGVCYLLGYALFKQGNNSMALVIFKKALRGFQNERNMKWQCKVNNLIALILKRRGEYSEALKLLEDTSRIGESIGDISITTVAWINTALVLSDLGKHRQAMQLHRKILSYSKKNKFIWGQAMAYDGLGDDCFFTGNFSAAMEQYRKALTLLNQLKDPLNLNAEDKADIYEGMANVYLYRGDLSSAFKMYQKALDAFDKAGLTLQKSDAYQGTGYIYALSGQKKRALRMYEIALNLCKKKGSFSGEANAYVAMALVYTDSDKMEVAAKMFDNALSKLEKNNSNELFAWVLLGKAKLFKSQRKWSQAAEQAEKALALFKKIDLPLGYSSTYEILGDIYYMLQKRIQALAMYREALHVYTTIQDTDSCASTELRIGVILVMMGKKDRALNAFNRGFSHFEKYRKLAAFSHIQTSMMEKFFPRFEIIFRMLVHMGYSKLAFRYGELFKARQFLDQLGEATVKLEKGISPARINQRDQLLAQLSSLVKQINQSMHTRNEEQLNRLNSQYRQTEKDYEDLLIHIRLNNPLYASVKYPKTVTIPAVQQILKKGEAMLRYFIFMDEICLFFISNYHSQVVRLKINETQMNAIVNRYRLALKTRDREATQQYGRKLYISLFKPVESLLQYVKTIFIVPDGHLALIPFESFPCDPSTYLLEKYTIKYIQSASVLRTLRKHYNKNAGTGQFIGFGDPVYNRDMIPLKAGGLEVRAISDLFKKNNRISITRLQEEADEESAKAAHLKYFDYIHFACHGILGDRYQGLVLSQLPTSKEDGYFTLDEIMNCDYNAQLVVLSACKTAKGKMARAEGITGLTRAVMYAGTPAVVASLWDVDDRGTKELMVKFYQNILENNMSKEAALRKAKIQMLSSGRYSSPYYWSAFVMYGE